MDGTNDRDTRESGCQKTYCAVSSREGDTSRYLAFPLRCKSWDCPACRKIKADQYKHRMKLLFDGRKLFFYTLTFEHDIDVAQAWSHVNASWNRLRTVLNRHYGSFDYVRILEAHKKSPYPHLHIISDGNFKPSYFGPAAVSAGFGWQLNKQQVSGAGAADYVTKYLTKEWTNDEAKTYRKQFRCRIISFSRGLLSPAPKSSGWQLLSRTGQLADCIAHIRTDYEWNTLEDGSISYLREGEKTYECTIVWTDRPPNAPGFTLDTWKPDDWIPK